MQQQLPSIKWPSLLHTTHWALLLIYHYFFGHTGRYSDDFNTNYFLELVKSPVIASVHFAFQIIPEEEVKWSQTGRTGWPANVT